MEALSPTQCALPSNQYPALSALVDLIDNYLEKKYPDFFGPDVSHPVLPVKLSKGIHDNLWGTNRFTWRELALIDSPIIQRLRNIHQVGLASLVYPSAHHTRFEHSLGVVTLASRIFDAIHDRCRGELENIVKHLGSKKEDVAVKLKQMKQELRLAALLHDTGHSLFSHTSERVFGDLDVLKKAASKLKGITGKAKGAGEAISFCLALSKSVARQIQRAKQYQIGERSAEDYVGEIDFTRVALMLVGRGYHPFLQFLGDIVSSGFDADKLDYLLRDAIAAGLPLRYDLDRYLYSVRLEREILLDDEGELQTLYRWSSTANPERLPPQGGTRYPYYETYRLRLPKKAMNAIEQIIICKMMLFSYLYHHGKVRAAEGMLELTLKLLVKEWQEAGEDDRRVLERFLDMTDSALYGPDFIESKNLTVRENSRRLCTRLIPRVVYSLSGDIASHAEKSALQDFLIDLQDKDQKDSVVAELESEIGQELLQLRADLGSTPRDALHRAGVWVDVPRAPKFEDVDDLMIAETNSSPGIPFPQIFPIGHWTQAYTHFRYCVRIYAFSEYLDLTRVAAKSAMQKVIGIQGDSFYKKCQRSRD